MRCANCGAELKEDAAFCTKCGTKIEAAGESASVQTPSSNNPVGGPIQPEQPVQQGKSKTALVVGICAAIVAVCAIIAIVVMLGGQQSSSSSSSAGATGSTTSSVASSASASSTAPSAEESKSAPVTTVNDGWYSTALYLYARNSGEVPPEAQDRHSAITFQGDTMKVTGALYRAESRSAAEQRTPSIKVSKNVNEFNVSPSCSFTILPPIQESSFNPRSTDYAGFQTGLYNKAMDLYDSVITFHVVDDQVVEAYQDVKGTS